MTSEEIARKILRRACCRWSKWSRAREKPRFALRAIETRGLPGAEMLPAAPESNNKMNVQSRRVQADILRATEVATMQSGAASMIRGTVSLRLIFQIVPSRSARTLPSFRTEDNYIYLYIHDPRNLIMRDTIARVAYNGLALQDARQR